MARHSPFEVRLSVDERAVLEERSSSRTTARAEVLRVRIVLLTAGGERNVEIVPQAGVCVDVADPKRFFEQRAAGLKERLSRELLK